MCLAMWISRVAKLGALLHRSRRRNSASHATELVPPDGPVSPATRDQSPGAFSRASSTQTFHREIIWKLGARTVEKVSAEECEHFGYGRQVGVEKHGSGISKNEPVAMKLVEDHTKVSTAKLLDSFFTASGDEGQIVMTYVPGRTLEVAWPSMDDNSKAKVCAHLWDIVTELRSVPRPRKLNGLFLCLADGSPSVDVLIRNFEDKTNALTTDEEVRSRIFERYQYCGGHQYASILPEMLPRSTRSVFTHADIAPRNIIVNSNGDIAGILDWERAGWYPDYWELARIIGPASRCGDFQEWMVKLCPEEYRCDLQGIQAARTVVFG